MTWRVAYRITKATWTLEADDRGKAAAESLLSLPGRASLLCSAEREDALDRLDESGNRHHPDHSFLEVERRCRRRFPPRVEQAALSVAVGRCRARLARRWSSALAAVCGSDASVRTMMSPRSKVRVAPGLSGPMRTEPTIGAAPMSRPSRYLPAHAL